MFGFFKKKEWVQEVLPEMQGTFGDVQVHLKRFPYRVHLPTGEKRFAYADFGAEFINELTDRELGHFDQLRQTLMFGSSKNVAVKLRDLPNIQVEVKGKISCSAPQFYSNLADALIAAFESQDIKP